MLCDVPGVGPGILGQRCLRTSADDIRGYSWLSPERTDPQKANSRSRPSPLLRLFHSCTKSDTARAEPMAWAKRNSQTATSGNFIHGRYRTRTYDLPHVKRMLIPAELIVQVCQAVSRSAMPYYKGWRRSCQALFCGNSKKLSVNFVKSWISSCFIPHKRPPQVPCSHAETTQPSECPPTAFPCAPALSRNLWPCC